MEFKTNDLIPRTVTENDIKEIARMWEYPHKTTIDKAYEALKYMEDTHILIFIGIIGLLIAFGSFVIALLAFLDRDKDNKRKK